MSEMLTDGLTVAWPTPYFLSTDEKEWQWVRLSTFCEIFGKALPCPPLTPDDMVQKFAHLAKTTERGDSIRRFWYAREILSGGPRIEEPQWQRPEEAVQFVARYKPYYHNAFVPDGWARDVAKAIKTKAMEILNLQGKLYRKDFFGNIAEYAA